MNMPWHKFIHPSNVHRTMNILNQAHMSTTIQFPQLYKTRVLSLPLPILSPSPSSLPLPSLSPFLSLPPPPLCSLSLSFKFIVHSTALCRTFDTHNIVHESCRYDIVSFPPFLPFPPLHPLYFSSSLSKLRQLGWPYVPHARHAQHRVRIGKAHLRYRFYLSFALQSLKYQRAQ